MLIGRAEEKPHLITGKDYNFLLDIDLSCPINHMLIQIKYTRITFKIDVVYIEFLKSIIRILKR